MALPTFAEPSPPSAWAAYTRYDPRGRALGLMEASRAEAARGLVHGPYVCAVPVCSIRAADGGNCVEIRRRPLTPIPRYGTNRRGLVREFSRRSRTRLQKFMCSLPRDLVGRGLLFITLTWPSEYPGDWKLWKRQLGAFFDRVRRKLPAACAIWKLEPQRRGAPHFHLLVGGVPFISKDWLSRAWYEVVKSGDEKHLKAGTNIQAVRSHRGVLSYAAKYTAKHQELPPDWADGVGRWWGVFNRPAFGVSTTMLWISQADYWSVNRLFRRLIRAREPNRKRGPPRSNAYGAWCVLTDAHASRIVAWLGTLVRPLLQVNRRGGTAGSPEGRELASEPSQTA